jgi:putative membrane-bound dehydrogenase-like protein
MACSVVGARGDDPSPAGGVLPTDARGRTLNLDFETGTLRDWTAEGNAFEGMPVEGDTVARRRSDMKSGHAGRFWIGGWERGGDDRKGTLTSVPFVVSKPYASFLVGGGNHPTTYVELVRKDTGRVIQRVSGERAEDMARVVVNLTPHVGQEVFIRLVDNQTGDWGHINFDDFRLHDTRPPIPAKRTIQDAFQHAGLPPAEAAKAMTVPEGFKVTLFAGEPDVHQPIAFAIDDRGRLWVAEAFSYPIRRPASEARDQIVIFEDKDNDGHYDSKKVFADKLNLVSGLELGFGGVWVGAAPELLFIPDLDGDDRPDGAPEVVLDGWGLQDTHETLNSFIWGPDGWLYGCHGVFTHSRVGKPGTPDKDRVPINAGIWRYHPTKRRFEVFAHGTSNPWGFDFDANGQGFLTSCVIPHLYHIIPGARYERQGGQHFNPYTFDDIKTIADHRHYVGNIRDHAWWGHAPVPADATLSAGGGHAHSGAMIYKGDAWPASYRGSIYMNNIHGARINRDVFKPEGSGFVGSHAPDLLVANDSWSQIISIKSGPDGNVYMIDWYDGQQCHVNDPARHDRSNGRIFKVSYGQPKPAPAALGRMNDIELVKLLASPNEWHVRMARRLLQERSQKGFGRGEEVMGRISLAEMVMKGATEHDRLRALWALHSIGGTVFNLLEAPFASGTPAEIGWKVRLAFEDKNPSPVLLTTVRDLAASTTSPVVRLEIASALQRTPLNDRWPILEALVAHGEDADDHNIPYLIWYAAEPLAEVDGSRLLTVALAGKIPMVRDFAIRRVGGIGTPGAVAGLVDSIAGARDASTRLALLRGLNEALKGRRRVEMPPRWPAVFAALAKGADAETRSQATALGLTFGDVSARTSLREVVADVRADVGLRREALAALLKAKDDGLAPILQRLATDTALRGEALRGLAGYDDSKTPGLLLGLYGKLAPEERRDALNTLAARPSFAKELLAAVEAGRVPRADLSADLVRQLRNLNDPGLNATIARAWGSARPTSADRARQIAEFKKKLTGTSSETADVALGRAVFAKTCAQCHTLFGDGGKVGPDLTGSNRRDLQYALENILDPSALIGKDYLAHVVALSDGRTLTGIIRGEDKDAITLVTANETLTIPLGEVEARRPSEASMMPEDLLKPLNDLETRGLIAYLASPGQTPLLATPENAAAFFNGRDLTGWEGDPKLWSVEGGEIVGKSSGLKKNEFLRSTLLAGDFRLTLEVKLANNQGNSGIQFRSEPLADGEMKGDQADVGPGWWGKLYEENGRGLLWDKSGEAHVKPGDWNRYEIVAEGSKIRTVINGHPCVDLDDPKGARRGIFAFQLHSGGPTEVRFRNIRLEVLGGSTTAASR